MGDAWVQLGVADSLRYFVRVFGQFNADVLVFHFTRVSGTAGPRAKPNCELRAHCE